MGKARDVVYNVQIKLLWKGLYRPLTNLSLQLLNCSNAGTIVSHLVENVWRMYLCYVTAMATRSVDGMLSAGLGTSLSFSFWCVRRYVCVWVEKHCHSTKCGLIVLYCKIMCRCVCRFVIGAFSSVVVWYLWPLGTAKLLINLCGYSLHYVVRTIPLVCWGKCIFIQVLFFTVSTDDNFL
jgi:hypothetical protein